MYLLAEVSVIMKAERMIYNNDMLIMEAVEKEPVRRAANDKSFM